MTLRLIDSHCHLDDAAFDADRAAVLARAAAVGIEAIVLPAVTAASWPRMRTVAAGDPRLYASYGLHPMFMAEHRPEHLDALPGWLERERPVAVGECGLDFYIDDPDRAAQERYFDAQLGIARDFDLPVIVHSRKANDEVTKYIRRHPGVRGVIHSFSGSEQQARQLIDLGFCLGLGGPITHARARRLHRLVAELPLEALLAETDAPDQPGSAHRGQRNEPGFLPEVIETMARLRDVAPEDIAAATCENARRLFNLPLQDRPA